MPRKEQVRYWVSFDLGFQGNYDELYEWLDRHSAKECGDNVATFRSDKTRDQLVEELRGFLDTKKNRIYMINLSQGGRFVLGKRKVAPWNGYAQLSQDSGEEK